MTYPTLDAAFGNILYEQVDRSIRFERGTYSGRKVGEAAYSWYSEGRGATLFFVRRNVAAMLHYRPRTTASIKTGRRLQITPDPAVKQKIEELAGRIDDELKVLRTEGGQAKAAGWKEPGAPIREYPEVESSYVRDLRPVLAVLRSIYPEAGAEIDKKYASSEAPLEEIKLEFHVEEVAVDGRRDSSRLSISLKIYPTLAGALEPIMRSRRAILPIPYRECTYSGRRIGETANCVYGMSEAVLGFVRRNVHVGLRYYPTFSMIQTQLPDPAEQQQVENLARRLDAELKKPK
jgi:hypothetical protein